MNNKKDIEFLGKLQIICDLLDEVDKVVDENPDNQQQIDYKLSDYDHIIENDYDRLSDKAKLQLVKDIKEARDIRRSYVNIAQLANCYKMHQGKLLQKDNRSIFRTKMGITSKGLNGEYKYRVLESLDKYLYDSNTNESTQVSKHGRKSKLNVSKEELEEMLNSGMSNKAIAEKFGVVPSTITNFKKKYNMDIRKKDKHE